jgi:DNA-binding MarR family transcriptional regulator
MRAVARPARLDEDQRLVWKAYRDVYQGLSEVLQDQLLRDAGLSGSEYAVLVVLSYAPGGVVRAREICSELAWDRSRLSHLVGRMEKRGLVVREECSEDGRGTMVRLTDAGRAALEDAAPEHSEGIRRYFFNLLTKSEYETLATVLDRVLENITRAKEL